MLKLIVKFENFANKAIVKIALIFIAIIKKLVPQKIKDLLIQTEHQLIQRRHDVILKTQEKLNNIKIKALKKKQLALLKKQELQDKVKELKQIDYKQKALEERLKLIAFLKKTPPKKAFLLGLLFLLKPFEKTFSWLKSQFSINSFGTYFTLATITVGSSLIIYKNTQKIINHGRKPASVKTVYDYKKPYYYKQDRKQVLFTNLKLPVYFKSKKNVTSLTIDFNITTNYRKTLQEIKKNTPQIKDHLLLNVEPVEAEFPLEYEGRDILKTKIQEELNNFLRKNNIEGEVEEVQIVYVLGT